MSDFSLILHCSPTLANIKTGNLFSTDSPLAEYQVEQWNRELNCKGISVCIAGQTSARSVIYVYRKEKLESDLKDTEMRSFLSAYGYNDFSAEGAVSHLCARMTAHGDFPHEIGAFLGYPLNDIRGFIKNKGHNCKLCGIWKVYDNVEEAERKFAQFKKCRDIYTRLWQNGKTALQLTVSCVPAQSVHS